MTPLLAHLIEHVGALPQYIIESTSKDKGWLTGLVRDKDLSDLQRKNAGILHRTTITMKSKTTNDATVFKTLNDLVRRLLYETESAVKRSKGPDGTSWLLLEFELFQKRLKTAHDLYARYDLLDKENDESPLTIFKAALINYLVNKQVYLYGLQIGYYSKTGWLRSWTYDTTLSARKDSIVYTALDKNYLDSTVEALEGQINNLLLQDKELLDRQKVAGSVPVGVGMVKIDVPVSLIYNPKTLTDELGAARKILEKLPRSISSTAAPVLRSAPQSVRTESRTSQVIGSPPALATQMSFSPPPRTPTPPPIVKIFPDNDDDDDDDEYVDTASSLRRSQTPQ